MFTPYDFPKLMHIPLHRVQSKAVHLIYLPTLTSQHESLSLCSNVASFSLLATSLLQERRAGIENFDLLSKYASEYTLIFWLHV